MNLIHEIRFLKKLRLKQRENHIIDSIADILVDFFSALSAQKLKSAYGEFHITFMKVVFWWTLGFSLNVSAVKISSLNSRVLWSHNGSSFM